MTQWLGSTRSLHTRDVPELKPCGQKFSISAIGMRNAFDKVVMVVSAEQLSELANAIKQVLDGHGERSAPGGVCLVS